MAGPITAKEVARRAEVSVGTVSRVFNNHSNVSEELRQHVLKVAADLGYTRPGSLAGWTPGQVIKEICFLQYQKKEAVSSPPLDSAWVSIFSGVEREARRATIKLTYRVLLEEEASSQQLLPFLAEARPGGLLLVGPAPRETVRMLQSTGLPMILVNQSFPDFSPSIDAILGDNLQGTRLAMEHLLEMGHRRIAFIGGEGPTQSHKSYAIQQRWSSYCMTLLDYGLSIDPALVEASDQSIESGYVACQHLLARQANFSAIFCTEEALALGALQALREAGRAVPSDVSLISFGASELTRHITPALTSVSVNTDQLGAIAVRALLTRAANPEAPPVTHLLGATLLKQASVAFKG